MPRLVLAVDGGNSKTDVALMNGDGLLLSWVRGPGSALGAQRTAALVTRLAAIAAQDAGLTSAALARAHGAYYLAGADLPVQVDARREAIAAHQVLTSIEVGNDAWALLRLGAAAAAPAVAVVCGAGLKCVARAGDERYEFPGLGWQTGDLSGGGDFLAREAVRVAARAEDGRGADTRLREVICEQLAVPSVRAVAERLLTGTLAEQRLGELAPGGPGLRRRRRRARLLPGAQSGGGGRHTRLRRPPAVPGRRAGLGAGTGRRPARRSRRAAARQGPRRRTGHRHRLHRDRPCRAPRGGCRHARLRPPRDLRRRRGTRGVPGRGAQRDLP
ncbi:hypothetical protein Q2K19_01365 [Micromonospora soli]|uniref:hypothetical protein n=1 Tax=Micromonospora sp. NBRC 110009 TaxID=3061627 RepID=UPI0026718958|nr:hypothetical protein [Micromonospora sp. NBRC 110009]WKT99195.1 hypothetical protein Q2K19_01365 [Micromonospora sp. NBRC 110009]